MLRPSRSSTSTWRSPSPFRPPSIGASGGTGWAGVAFVRALERHVVPSPGRADDDVGDSRDTPPFGTQLSAQRLVHPMPDLHGVLDRRQTAKCWSRADVEEAPPPEVSVGPTGIVASDALWRCRAVRRSPARMIRRPASSDGAREAWRENPRDSSPGTRSRLPQCPSPLPCRTCFGGGVVCGRRRLYETEGGCIEAGEQGDGEQQVMARRRIALLISLIASISITEP